MIPLNEPSLQGRKPNPDDSPSASAPTVERTATYLPDNVRSERDLPAHLGRYRVEEEIARGGMGQVVRVHDQEFQRSLAMKVVRADGAHRPDAIERFMREARLTGQLQHPGIPPVQEMGRLPDGRPYFARAWNIP